jgi:hypothetical protein
MKRVLPFSTSTPLSPLLSVQKLFFFLLHSSQTTKNSLHKKKEDLNTCSKESAQNIINPFTALITESVVNFQPRLHVLRRRVLRRVKERESARKRNRRGKPLGRKRKKKKRSQIVPSARRRKRRIAFVSLFLREVDVFSFFFGRKVLSPQKVRETFGRRTAHFGRTHALR